MMADDKQQQDANSLSGMVAEAQSLDNAIASAEAALQDISAAAAEADSFAVGQSYMNCSVHEVSGVGRYAVPNKRGWKALLDLVHDKEVDINFSEIEYPIFDSVIVEKTQSPYLIDPDEPKFDSRTFRNLRDNIAAVRNFLIETYYANTPPGMSHADARKALKEIAEFVGDGLANNRAILGLSLLANHDPSKPFIDLDRAAEPDGAGAQYIYECILEMQRRSSWKRTFGPLVTMFGGGSISDWQLPAAMNTPFLDFSEEAFIATHEAEADMKARLANLQAERSALQTSMETSALAMDLELFGSDMLQIADRINSVTQLAEPVRREAIELAKDILRKLKVSIGDLLLNDGLQVNTPDAMAALNDVQGVTRVYHRLLDWARGVDPSIAQHPAVMAANVTVGQLGYLAKSEALRLAQAVGNTALVERLVSNISQMPDAYRNISSTTFGALMGRIEAGIDMLARVQAIQGPGASVGHNPNKDLGSYMAGVPIAGLAQQTTTDGSNRDAVGKRNAEILAAEEMVAQQTAARINSQTAARAQQQGQQQQTTQPARARGQQAVATARRQASTSSNTGTSSSTQAANQANLTAQQRQAMLRNAAMRAANAHHDEHADGHHNGPTPQQLQMQQIVLKNAAAIKAAKAATASVPVGTPVMPGRSVSANTPSGGLKPTATPNMKSATAPVKPDAQKSEAELLREKYTLQPTQTPPGKGGRGY